VNIICPFFRRVALITACPQRTTYLIHEALKLVPPMLCAFVRFASGLSVRTLVIPRERIAVSACCSVGAVEQLEQIIRLRIQPTRKNCRLNQRSVVIVGDFSLFVVSLLLWRHCLNQGYLRWC